jgi:hypothetical protein
VSSFETPHHLYLFAMTNGRRKLAYGETPEDALEILACRLSEAEMAQIVRDDYLRIHQKDLHDYVADLG